LAGKLAMEPGSTGSIRSILSGFATFRNSRERFVCTTCIDLHPCASDISTSTWSPDRICHRSLWDSQDHVTFDDVRCQPPLRTLDVNGATWILNFKIFKWAMGRRHGDTVREWWITTCLVLTQFNFDLGLFCFVLRFRRQLEKGFVRFCKCLSYFDYYFL
jgi:hypothetical protein